MPLLTELGTITRQIYKDAAPTALRNAIRSLCEKSVFIRV
jgi:hypothetical protein